MYNAGNRRHIREAEKRSKVADANRRTVIVALCDHEGGRQWLWEQLEAAHLFNSPYPSDPYQAYFILGQRNQGQVLLDDLVRWCPDQFIQMMREANGRRSRADNLPDDPNRSAGESGDSEESGRVDEGPVDLDTFTDHSGNERPGSYNGFYTEDERR